MATNYEILLKISKEVYKHDKAKKVLINLVNRSKLRCSQIWEKNQSGNNLIPNMNCLLIAKSGTGKTHLIETLSKVMDFHFVCIDATRLAPTSATGVTSTGILHLIKKSAENYYNLNSRQYYDVQEVIDQTIVFIDEIDKLAPNFGSNGWNEHVQDNFLTIFENKAEGYNNLSWIFAGAFSKLIKKHKETKTIGFHSIKNDRINNDIETEIIEYGLTPELIGRIHHVIELDELTKEDYTKILTDIIIPQRIKQLGHANINPLVLEELDIEETVEHAFKSSIGVRALSKAIDTFLIDIEFHQPPKFKLTQCSDTQTGRINYDLLNVNN